MKFPIRGLLFSLMLASLLVGCSHDPNVRKQKYLESGMRFFEKGKYNEAAIQFSNAIQVDPNFAPAHYQLGLTYLKLQQISRAYQELSTTVDKQPDNVQAQIDLANLLIGARQFSQAKEHLDVVATKQPDNPQYHMALANYHAGMKELPAALQEMQKAIAANPNGAELYLNLAVLQMSAGQFDAAEASFKKAVSVDPKMIGAQLALGSFYQTRGRLPEAEEQFRHAVQTDGNNTDARSALVRLLVFEGKNGEAEAFLKQTKSDLPNNPAAYTMLGDYYFELANDPDRALNEYEALYRDHPKDAKVRKNYIQLLILKNRLEEAAKIDDEILKINPQDSDGLILRAQIKLRQGRPSEAVTALQDVLPRDPDNAAAHFQLGVAFDQLGDQSRAASEWREAVRLRPDFLDAHRSLAGVSIAKGDWNALSQTAATIISLQPGAPDGYVFQAIAQANLKRPEQAESSIEKAIEVAPKNPLGYIQLGALRASQSKFADAEKAYRQALDLSPESADALAGLMRVYLAEKNPDKAVQIAREQIVKSPNNSGFYDLLGTALFEGKKDFAGAEAAFQKAISLDANNNDAVLKLGEVYVAQGGNDKAIAFYEQATKQHPRDLGTLILLGELYESKKDWTNARATYQKVLDIQSDNPIASNNLAYVMLQQGGNVDVALAMAQTARRAMPDNANAADTLGWAYYKKGAYGSAIDLFKEAVQRSPNDPSFHYHLGLAYQQAGKPALAREHLETVLKMNPNFSEADDVKRVLAELRG
jgi:tetratricopeptide (TPR) repeat protein